MKHFNIIISLVFLFASCNVDRKGNDNIQTINPENIQVGPIRHDTLTSGQIEKITRIQSAFAEVYPVSLEQTITDFKRDLNPDSEIDIWLNMANAYEKYLNSKQGKLTLDIKKEVYKLILSRSMMPTDEAIKNSKLTILTEKEAQEVVSFYTADPDPIDVIKK